MGIFLVYDCVCVSGNIFSNLNGSNWPFNVCIKPAKKKFRFLIYGFVRGPDIQCAYGFCESTVKKLSLITRM